MKTNIAATYVSATQFTVAGDYSSTLTAGRKVRASCGADGIKICVVESASYASPDTTVNVSGDALTSNLTGFLFGVSDVDALPEHDHVAAEVTDLGTAALVDTGTAEGDVPVLGSGGTLPESMIDGLGTAAVRDTGTSENNIPILGTGGKLPAVSGEDLTGVLKTGKHSMWIPAKALWPMVTNGPELVAVEVAAYSPHVVALAFDPATTQYAEIGIAMPKSWDEGTLSAKFFWAHPETDTNFGVVWGIGGGCVGNDDAMGTSPYGTAQEVADAGGTTNDLYISAESSAITIGGAAEGEYLSLRVHRNATDASDTLAVDAYLIGIKILYTLNAGDDS